MNLLKTQRFRINMFKCRLLEFKVVILVNLWQVNRDIFRTINARVEIQSALDIVANCLREAYLP